MTLIASILLVTGSFFVLVAAIGIVRMPDLYCRMHAATKAGAFGVTLMLVALMAAIPSLRVVIQGLLIIIFFFLTAPLAAHMIGRAALLRKTPLWQPGKAAGDSQRYE